MSSTEELAAAYILPPRAGQVANISVTTSAGSQDLRLVGLQTPNLASAAKVGAQGRYVTFYADGADVGVIFGATSASVTGANAPSLAAVGVNAVGACWRIASGGKEQFYLAAGTDVFVGFVGSAAGSLRVVSSSP